MVQDFTGFHWVRRGFSWILQVLFCVELALTGLYWATEVLGYWAITGLLVYYWATTGLLLGYYWATGLLLGYWAITGLLLDYWAITGLLLDYLAITGLLGY